MKHSHYTKDVSHLSAIDVYRVLSLFGVTDQAIGHAIKKLLCAGQRGVKTKRQDIQEAIDALERWKAMEDEDSAIRIGHVEPVKVKYPDAEPAPIVGMRCLVCNKLGGHGSMPCPENLFTASSEPATAIDDESPRMQAIGQNGNGGG